MFWHDVRKMNISPPSHVHAHGGVRHGVTQPDIPHRRHGDVHQVQLQGPHRQSSSQPQQQQKFQSELPLIPQMPFAPVLPHRTSTIGRRRASAGGRGGGDTPSGAGMTVGHDTASGYLSRGSGGGGGGLFNSDEYEQPQRSSNRSNSDTLDLGRYGKRRAVTRLRPNTGKTNCPGTSTMMGTY